VAAAGIAPYGRFVRRRIGAYLEEHIALPPKALVLTAVVEGGAAGAAAASNGGGAPEASSSSSESATSSGADGSSSSSTSGRALVGTAEISFDPSTRSAYFTLNPPTEGAFVCNMAVAPGWRRRGVATQLMRAVEEVAGSIAGASVGAWGAVWWRLHAGVWWVQGSGGGVCMIRQCA